MKPIEQQFKEFLIEHNAYENYMEEASFGLISRFSKIVEDVAYKSQLINLPLTWMGTKQGSSYWANLDKLWRDIFAITQKEKLTPLFIALLTRKSALSNFEHNLKQYQDKSLDGWLGSDIQIEDCLKLAFNWDETPESRRYWQGLNNLWDEEIYNNQ